MDQVPAKWGWKENKDVSFGSRIGRDLSRLGFGVVRRTPTASLKFSAGIPAVNLSSVGLILQR